MNKKKIKIGILIFSLLLQSMNAIALVISGVAATYPDATTTSVQLVYTLITLMSVFGTLLAGKLAGIMTKKKIAMIFCSVLCLGGVFGYFFANSLIMLYVASIIIGIGNGVIFPISSGLIAEHFEGGERASVTGIQALFVSGGGFLINYVGGMLAASYWKNTYLLYLSAIPAIIVIMILLPEGNVEKAEQGEKVKLLTPFLIALTIQAFIFGICWMTLLANATYYIFDLGIGNESQASLLSMAMSVGSIIIGLLLRRVMALTKDYCFVAAFACATFSLWILSFGSNLTVLIIGCVMLGIGFGLFMPLGYTLIPNKVHPAAITMSIAVFTAAFSLGGFMNPYIITVGAALINDRVATRFVLAAILQTVNLIFCFTTTTGFATKQR